MRQSLILFIAFIPLLSLGQVDSQYIEIIPSDKNLAIHTTFKDFSLAFSDTEVETRLFQNRLLGIGIGAQYKKIGAIVSLPVKSFNPSSAGHPYAIGAGLNLYPKRFHIQGNFQYIEGFDEYNSDRQALIPVFRGDSRMAYGTLIGSYIVNGKRFSLRSAYKMVNRQKRSAGSLIISVPLSYQYFVADSLSLNTEDEMLNIDVYNSFNSGLGGGYAYTFVKGYWATTVFGSGGLEWRYLELQDKTTQEKLKKAFITPRFRLQGSIVYNRRTYFGGLLWQYLPNVDVISGINTEVNNWQIRLMVGRRFF